MATKCCLSNILGSTLAPRTINGRLRIAVVTDRDLNVLLVTHSFRLHASRTPCLAIFEPNVIPSCSQAHADFGGRCPRETLGLVGQKDCELQRGRISWQVALPNKPERPVRW